MKLVLCEGEDDKKVISGLCEANSIDGLEVQPYKGRDNLRAFVRALTKRPDFVRGEIESVGIVQDADQDGRAAWERVRDAVEAAFGVVLVEPAKPVGERPRIAGFVLARQGEDRGVLEDLCLTAVSQQAGYFCLEDYFRCLTEKTGKQTFHPKAKFRAWMASQSDYDLRTGLAAEQGYVPYTNAAFDALRDFLRGL
jgi:hypothetical protein